MESKNIWYAIINPDEEAAAERGEDVAYSWDWEGADNLKDAIRIAESLRDDDLDVRTIVAVDTDLSEYDHHYTRDDDGDWVSSATDSWQF